MQKTFTSACCNSLFKVNRSPANVKFLLIISSMVWICGSIFGCVIEFSTTAPIVVEKINPANKPNMNSTRNGLVCGSKNGVKPNAHRNIIKNISAILFIGYSNCAR